MNKTILITGSTSMIGTEIAKLLAKKQYNIILHYNKSEERANLLKEELINDYHIECMTIRCDLKEEKEIDEMLNKLPNIDILINNAAIELNSDFNDKTFSTFEEVLKTNLIGPFVLSKHLGSLMYKNKYGKIINISSNNAIDQYDPSTIEYDVSKAGLISLTHNLALQYAPYVNVNAISPGWIKTDPVNKLNKELNGMLEQEESKKILKERFGEPKEVASLVAYLISDEAEYINNEVIRIDGGIR